MKVHLNKFQQKMHNLLIEYATTRFRVRGGGFASNKTAKDYAESMERYLPKEAKQRFGLSDFPETAYDVESISKLERTHDMIEENREWKLYDGRSHGSSLRGGLKCLIAMRRDERFLTEKGQKNLYQQNCDIQDENNLKSEGNPYESHCVRYERDKSLREKCIKYYGCKCYVCGFDFEKVYGEMGKNFIEVHHLQPLSETGKEHITNPIEDMRPLCSNCHSMVHTTNPPREVENMKKLFSSKLIKEA